MLEKVKGNTSKEVFFHKNNYFYSTSVYKEGHSSSTCSDDVIDALNG